MEAFLGADWGLYFLVLWLVSEALAMLPFIKANSVFGAIANALKFLKDMVKPKLPGA